MLQIDARKQKQLPQLFQVLMNLAIAATTEVAWSCRLGRSLVARR